MLKRALFSLTPVRLENQEALIKPAGTENMRLNSSFHSVI